MFGSRGKGTVSVHPVPTESTSAFFFRGRKIDSAPKFWSPGSNPGVYPASSSSRLGIALVVLNASLVKFRTMPMSLMYGILSPVHAGNSRTHALRHIDMDIVELCWYDSLSRTREQGRAGVLYLCCLHALITPCANVSRFVLNTKQPTTSSPPPKPAAANQAGCKIEMSQLVRPRFQNMSQYEFGGSQSIILNLAFKTRTAQVHADY